MSRDEPPCPCGRPAPYADCCGVYHRGGEPEDAETLMRSRYAAFVRKEIPYLRRTLHPSHDEGQSTLAAFEAGLRKHFAAGFVYKKLEVIDTTTEDDEGISKVLFVARIAQRGKDRSFAEVSSFARDGVGIRYLTGVTLPVAKVRDLSGAGAIAEAERRSRTR